MNAKNLPLKFSLLALVIGLCIWAIASKGLKEGIDLRGGSSLQFQIRTPQVELKEKESARRDLEARIAKATSDAEKKNLQAELKGLDAQIEELKKAPRESDIADKTITILKKRVDPLGLYSLEWRPAGSDRIEVRMPAGSDQSRQAKENFTKLRDDLEAANIQRSHIRAMVNASKADRPDMIARLSGGDKTLAVLLDDVCATHGKMQDIQKSLPELQDAVNKARGAVSPTTTQPEKDPKVAQATAALDKARGELENLETHYQDLAGAGGQIEQNNISIAELQTVLDKYITDSEYKSLVKLQNKAQNRPEGDVRREDFNRSLDNLYKDHATRKAQIEKVVAAYETWGNTRSRLDDPSDLIRLIRKAGVLEFRVAPYMPGYDAFTITPGEEQRYKEELQKEGPLAGRKRNERLAWFALLKDEGAGGFITDIYKKDGKRYVLLYNDGDENHNTLLNPPGSNSWSVRASAGSDQYNRPAVNFSLDPRGASKMAALTATHKTTDSRRGHCMAILLDDEVYSAPVIQATISSSGIIEGTFTPQEVKDLVATFDAGSLPARLNPDPVAQNSFGSSFGEVNKKSSIKAGEIALISILAFMLIYYLLSGVIANVALILNLILIVGAMSLLDVAMTMPGIAGLILSIGMAVDANVLINERLREEQEKGLSVRMALKNAYDRALSAIIDCHVTTLVTSLILGWVGTPEVRGFAITLGLGIIFNFFTAVFVTRWIFQIMLGGKLIRSHQYMLHVFKHVPHVDWIGKRYYFWAFSLTTMVLGIIAIVWQGSRIWGIEFSAGTQATLVFQDEAVKNKNINDKLVQDKVMAVARQLNQENGPDSLDKRGNKLDFTPLVDNIRVETLLGQQHPSFRINTTLHDPEGENGVALEMIRHVATRAFGGDLVTRPRLAYALAGKGSDLGSKLGLPMDEGNATFITDDNASRVRSIYRSDFLDYSGGVAVVVNNVAPAVTAEELEQRIKDLRNVPEVALAGAANNPVKILGLTPAGKDAKGNDTFSSLVVLARPAEGAATFDDQARQDFKDRELGVVKEALERQEAMTANTFSAAIAGETANLALVAVILSWAAIIVYLWFRFGSFSWGAAAVICLVHDSFIIIGMVAISSWLAAHTPSWMLISDFKIDLAMVAAVLTVIGYSVNDTIVIFDRIRENRGKLHAVNAQIINDSINQTLSRTVLTVFTVLLVVFVMYVWAGEAIRGFNYALLIGIFFGSYSSIAVASPILLGFKKMITTRTVAQPAPAQQLPGTQAPDSIEAK